MNEDVLKSIERADQLIKEERFDELMEEYTDDAVLVIAPPLKLAKGKEEIKSAFVKIAKYFNNSLKPAQGKMVMLETGDTILVLSQTFLTSDNQDSVECSMERRATYIYRLCHDGKWRCAIDNSYGSTLLD